MNSAPGPLAVLSLINVNCLLAKNVFFMKSVQPELNEAWRAKMGGALYPSSEQKALETNTEPGGPSHLMMIAMLLVALAGKAAPVF